jgi:hypothetical protein
MLTINCFEYVIILSEEGNFIPIGIILEILLFAISISLDFEIIYSIIKF